MVAKATETYEEVCNRVFQELCSLNVNEHIEKKNGLSYLSWAWAYIEMMNRYPTFDYKFNDEMTLENGTVMVSCETWITLGEHTIKRNMWLPVMNYRNQAIANPNTMDINTAKMRCLTKCISMHGLGAYVYAGEDLPQEDTQVEAKPAPAKAEPKPAAKPPAKPAVKKTATVTDIRTKFKVNSDDEESEFVIDDAESAADVVNLMLDLAKTMHSNSMDNLASFWLKNGQITGHLQSEYPEQYEVLKSGFTEIKQSLNQQEDF